MILNQLSLINFKNYDELSVDLSEKVNCFVGNNGVGKTNLLDAIYYLSFCKSYFNPVDSQNILNDAPFFVIQGIYRNNGSEDNIYCGLKRGERKSFKRNKKEYQRLADHIGLIPLVIISPSDTNLIASGSEERRKFIDGVISQYDKLYLDDLLNYNRALQQRNALLKRFAEARTFDRSSLSIWDEQLITLGNKVHEVRVKFIEELVGIFQHYYTYIAGDKEKVFIDYSSKLNEKDFSDLLEEAMDKDRVLQYTSVGIHKDDLVFRIGDSPIKKFGSQGQQKTFLIALKLAQFDFIKKIKKLMPLLLLDDIFDKLDDERVGKLMQLVSDNNFGQIFITDTHPERISDVFKGIGIDKKVFTVREGKLVNSQ